jgi:hypothetical protein
MFPGAVLHFYAHKWEFYQYHTFQFFWNMNIFAAENFHVLVITRVLIAILCLAKIASVLYYL